MKPSTTFTLMNTHTLEQVNSEHLKFLSDIRETALPVRLVISQVSDDLYYMGCIACKKKISVVRR